MNNILDEKTKSEMNAFKKLSEEVMGTTLDDLEEESKQEEYNVEMATEEQKTEELKNTLSSDYGLSDNDVASMINIIKKQKQGKEIEMRDLTFSMQSLMSKLCVENGISGQNNINSFINDTLENINFGATVDAEINNFNSIIQKEFQMDGMDLVGEYSTKMKEYYEVTILENAKKAEEDGNIENAEKLRNMSKVFTKSYKYDEIMEAFKKDRKMKKKVFSKNTASTYGECCLNYNILMKNHSDLIVRDAAEAGNGLFKHVDTDITNIDIAKFIIAICTFIERYLNIVSNKFDMVYAYYLLTHLMNLNEASKDNISEFDKEIINNATNCIREIKRVEEETLN
jgi:hypothetical protein